MSTGEELRDARMRVGMTQQEVADALGVALRTVGNWERGEVPRGQLARVNALLKPAEAPPLPLAAYDDLALIGELARRLTEYRSRMGDQSGDASSREPSDTTEGPAKPGLRYGTRRPRPTWG